MMHMPNITTLLTFIKATLSSLIIFLPLVIGDNFSLVDPLREGIDPDQYGQRSIKRTAS